MSGLCGKHKKAEQALGRSLRSLFEQLAWRTLPAAVPTVDFHFNHPINVQIMKYTVDYVGMHRDALCRHQRLHIRLQALQSRLRSSAQGLLHLLCALVR